ncbi:MAG TPA: hypothetical protein PKY11_10375 [Kiritimatiellia bacterium]|nr:hypothetical protein [Kiritimatiellia bacterium]HPK70268.1 hypothetical protein [Kiritimatiellia bacterium]
MKSTSKTILGVHVAQRTKHTTKVQKILSAYGCSIRTRVGLHDAYENVCSPNGLILLEVVSQAAELAAALAKVPGVKVKKMVFGE